MQTETRKKKPQSFFFLFDSVMKYGRQIGISRSDDAHVEICTINIRTETNEAHALNCDEMTVECELGRDRVDCDCNYNWRFMHNNRIQRVCLRSIFQRVKKEEEEEILGF